MGEEGEAFILGLGIAWVIFFCILFFGIVPGWDRMEETSLYIMTEGKRGEFQLLEESTRKHMTFEQLKEYYMDYLDSVTEK